MRPKTLVTFRWSKEALQTYCGATHELPWQQRSPNHIENLSTPKINSFRRTNEYLTTTDRRSHQLFFPFQRSLTYSWTVYPGISNESKVTCDSGGGPRHWRIDLWCQLLLSRPKTGNRQNKEAVSVCLCGQDKGTVECSQFFYFCKNRKFWPPFRSRYLKEMRKFWTWSVLWRLWKVLEERHLLVAFSNPFESNMYIKQSFSSKFSTIEIQMTRVALRWAFFLRGTSELAVSSKAVHSSDTLCVIQIFFKKCSKANWLADIDTSSQYIVNFLFRPSLSKRKLY